MLSSLLRPRRRRSSHARRPLLLGRDERAQNSSEESGQYDEQESREDFLNPRREGSTLLPLFSAAHLGIISLSYHVYLSDNARSNSCLQSTA
jgi:hypothetical protein